MSVDWDDPESAASALAGNHRRFESFSWHDKPQDDADWCIQYVANRDSDLLTESNAEAITADLSSFTEGDDPDVVPERHSHWAAGWVDGFAIRVRRGGVLTPAFLKWCEMQARLEDYPVLDEEDFCEREYEATLDNIESEGRNLLNGAEPDDWARKVFDWLWDNDQGAVEPVDGGGGCPGEDELKAALFDLGWLDDEHQFRVTVDGEPAGHFLDRNDALDAWESHHHKHLGGRDVRVLHGDEVMYPETIAWLS